MFESSSIELSKSALTKNLKFLQKKIGTDVLISSVIKGNAYGHGMGPFVQLAEECGIKHFSVFDASEAFEVHTHKNRTNTEIMIMGYADYDALAWAIENGVSFYVFDKTRLTTACALAKKIKKPARIHLEIETGMNRTGLKEESLREVVEIIKQEEKAIQLVGVCTHYAGAESVANFKRIQDQINNFHNECQEIENFGLHIPVKHTAASAAALSYPETRMDMVRIGIAQYGFWPTKETEMHYMLTETDKTDRHYTDPLRQVLRWSSKVMDVSEIKAGKFIGYGTSYMTLRPQKIAVVPVGYANGFRRSLSNLGRVLIHGKRANVIGLVNMSMILIDVTSIPSIEKGDEVVIIGKQNKTRISVSSFSDMANLVNYEMLVRLPADIPRVIVN